MKFIVRDANGKQEDFKLNEWKKAIARAKELENAEVISKCPSLSLFKSEYSIVAKVVNKRLRYTY